MSQNPRVQALAKLLANSRKVRHALGKPNRSRRRAKSKADKLKRRRGIHVEPEVIIERQVLPVERMTGASPDHTRVNPDNRGGQFLGNSNPKAIQTHYRLRRKPKQNRRFL